ncbi:MAG: cell wall-binding repeat-containing protein [Solirubrobacterales bacterium]
MAFILAAVLGGTGGGSAPEGTGTTSAAPPAEPAADGGAQGAEALGFPGFATNNTTRVGGADAPAVAAAAALAAFPSRTAAQRPAAVALVGEEDWAGAVAAAVLMAEPVRAPLLISGRELPEVTAEALEALAPAGFEGGAQAFRIGGVAVPDELRTAALGSRDAATEAAEIAKLRRRLAGSRPRHIVVAPASAPELAVPAAAWAARSGDPVLFAERDDLPAATATALRENAGVPVYVLGPAAAISGKVLAGIRKIAGTAKRVAGDDPVANAVAFARFDGGAGFGWNVNDPGHGFVLARAEAPLAAAAAAALSGSGTWGPLLLTDSAAKLPAEVRSYFLDVKPGYTNNPTRAFYNHVWVIGDQEAIDVNQQAEVNELAELARIGGEG